MQKSGTTKCGCPFCVQELTRGCNDPSFCSPCTVAVVKCAECGTSYACDTHAQCPKCGPHQGRKKP